MKKTKCYIYTRVSTAMQVDGYSLDAQKDKLKRYAAYGRFLKTIRFRFPVYYGGLETEEIDLDSSNFWDKETTGEVVSLLQKMSNTRERTITLDVEMEDYHRIKNRTEKTADATE